MNQMMDPVHAMRPGVLQLNALPPLALYVHLPWCIKKCPYCDFNSHEFREGADPVSTQDAYIHALLADLEASLPLIWGRSIQTVFLGGGTPSLFSPEAIDRLISGIRARVRLAPQAEITMEANPGTFEKDRFKAFHQAGITRLSIGVQSFDNAHLKALGRMHDRDQALAAVTEAAQVFDTFNLDLMYALPGQTIEGLTQDIQTALAFAPPHISIYHLTIEPNTVFAKFPPALPEEDLAYEMMDRITELTALAGLDRYEVSAYAKPGHQCAHNLNYWQFGDYLGIGAGAHSKLSFAHRVMRQVRYREPALYMQQAMKGEPVTQSTEVSRQDLPFEFMLNALRLRGGFAVADYADRTGLAMTSIQAGLQEAEKLGLIGRDLHRVWPTEKGFDFLSDLQSLFLSNSDSAQVQ